MRRAASLAVVVTLSFGCNFPRVVPADVDGGIPRVGVDASIDAAEPMSPAEEPGLYADPTRGGLSSADAPDPTVGRCAGRDDGVVCAEGMCDAIRNCCIDDGRCCGDLGTASPTPGPLALTGCAEGAPIADCVPPTWIFGAPAPFLSGGGIAPGGDSDGDSGLFLGETVDLGVHRVTLTGTFEPPSRCDGACVESVALGVTTQRAVPTTVRPVAALVLSGARMQMSFMVGDAIIDQWSVTTAEEWSLDLAPSGTAVVKRAGAEVSHASFARARDARAVIFGRTLNRSVPSPTRVRDVVARTALCDMVDGYRDRAPLTVLDASDSPMADVHGPSLADVGGARALAFATSEGIFVARPTGTDDEWKVTTPTPLVGAANLMLDAATTVEAGTRLEDPELVETPTHTLLFMTVTPPAGERGVGYVDLGAGTDFRTTSAWTLTRVMHPAPLAEPTAHYLGGESTLVLVAREQADGESRFVVLRSPDEGASFVVQGTMNLDALTRRGATPENDPTFDADEVAHPSLTVHDGAWQLVYAGRRGARWTLGTLLSDNLVWWRAAREDDGVLASAHTPEDAVGLTEPDALADPTAPGVDLVYTALDGLTAHPQRAHRPASTSAVWAR